MIMREVLISVQPKWCEKIAHIIGQNGTKPIYEKSVEIRKTRPKIDVPFKCYIYCTKSRKPYESFAVSGNPYECGGKVIGEFVCDRIQSYESEFVDDDCYEEIASVFVDEDGDVTGFIEWSNDCDFSYEHIDLYEDSCVKYEELKKYIGLGFNKFYGWHISDLVIYDKPKELSEFQLSENIRCSAYLNRMCLSRTQNDVISCRNLDCQHKKLTRPPQSWCYVELKERF